MEFLNVRPGLDYVDATAGAGGHLQEIIRLQAGAGRVIGIDRDSSSLERLAEKVGDTAQLVHANYCDIEQVLTDLGIHTIKGGILADLGVSSMQIDNAARGFSFLADGPLDMRMDPSAKLTAAQLINSASERELADIIYRYGEERQARRIARSIVAKRPLNTTGELAELVRGCLKSSYSAATGRRDRSHPATRTFQAVRIAVNQELESLEKFLHAALKVLAPGARLVIITFHSLEDRLVKQIFREAASECLCPPRQPVCTCHHEPELLIMTRKPALPCDKEVLANPRSRSAKLRAGEKAASGR